MQSCGYLDTASADRRRRISPAEQHVHSVLDAAPWILLVWVGWLAQPQWAFRAQPAAPEVAALLVVLGARPGGPAVAMGVAALHPRTARPSAGGCVRIVAQSIHALTTPPRQ